MHGSTKVIELGSAAFRQWKATHSHCRYIHGYELKAKLWFECKTLDDKNWCMDFGDFKAFKDHLQSMFDHKLVVAEDDPCLELFRELEKAEAVKLTILKDGVGCERFAEMVYNSAVDFFQNDRVRVARVELFEHDRNSAIYVPPPRNIVKVDTIEEARAVLAGQQSESETETASSSESLEVDPLAPGRKKTWNFGTKWI